MTSACRSSPLVWNTCLQHVCVAGRGVLIPSIQPLCTLWLQGAQSEAFWPGACDVLISATFADEKMASGTCCRVQTVEALGCGPLRPAVVDSLQLAMEGTQALPMAVALAAGRLAETGALPAAGAGAAAEQVLRQLPMLTDLRSATNWDLLFQAHLGTLDAFVLAHGEPAGKNLTLSLERCSGCPVPLQQS